MAMDLQNEPNLSEYCVDHWTWDKRDKYHRGFLFNGNGLRTKSNMKKTVGVRGTQILNKGRYYWEINAIHDWGYLYGNNLMGIGTKNCPLNDLETLKKGETDHQYWLLSDLGSLWQNGHLKDFIPHVLGRTYTVGIFFDGINGTLSFYENGKYLGVAFTDLHLVKEDLYPIFVTSRSSLEMSLKLAKRECLDLQDRCKVTILKNIKDERDIKKLKLPKIIKQFLNGEEYRKRIREKNIIERREFWREKFRRKRI